METPKYRIERFTYGWLIFGPVPVDDITTLMKLLPSVEEGIVDGLVSKHFRATMALVANKEDSNLWRKALSIEV